MAEVVSAVILQRAGVTLDGQVEVAQRPAWVAK